MIYELAKKNENVIFMGSDLSPGLLSEMKKTLPNNHFMEGISEANLIGVCAGLASEGFFPFFTTIATFLTRRSYEQIYVDVGLHNLPVRLVGIGAGLNYSSLGPTHLAIDDISLMRNIPNMTILICSDKDEMKAAMNQINDIKTPVYIRLAKGFDPIVKFPSDFKKIGEPRKVIYKKESYPIVISTGIMTYKVQNVLKKINKNINHLHLNTINTESKKKILRLIKKSKKIITVEEHLINNGLGDYIIDILVQVKQNNIPPILKIGIKNQILSNYGTQNDLLKICYLDENSLQNKIKKFIL